MRIDEIKYRSRMRDGRIEMYPRQSFWLPTSVIDFYDDPYRGQGDDGYSVEEVKAFIQQGGNIWPIEVGRSRADIEQRGDQTVRAFQGNHRLAATKELGLPRIWCENSASDDAVPLTIDEIIKLDGSFDAHR